MPPSFVMPPSPGVPPRSEQERRRARSSDPLIALKRLLEAARRAGPLDTLAIADETGCLVAGAGRAAECAELAALAPLIEEAPAPANDVTPTRLEVLARATEVRRLSVDGIAVLICGQGAESGLGAGLSRASRGCERILREGRRRLR